jgi:hypothetical protein
MRDITTSAGMLESSEGPSGQLEAQVGPFRVLRSDGFHSRWELGTTDRDIDTAIQAAIRRALGRDQPLDQDSAD